MPTTIVRDDTNTPRTISKIVVRDDTNTPRNVLYIYVRDSNNVSRLVFFSGTIVTVSASPNPVQKTDTTGSGVVTTPATTVTAGGGAPPYSYAWTLISHTHPTTLPTALSPTSNVCAFRQTNMPLDTTYLATFRCTVTDFVGQTGTVDVNATFIETQVGP